MSIQSIHRAASVLRSFSEADPELSVTQLSHRLALHKSTVSRILSTLQEEGLVGQNQENGKYRLGVGLISMAGVALGRVDVRRAAFHHLDDLVQVTQETITVNILDGHECVIVDTKASPKPLRYASWIGRRLPLYCTASGKTLLSGLTAEQRREILPFPLKRFTAHTITDSAELDDELDRIFEQRYAISEEEFEEGSSAIASPILDHRDHVVGALTISGPSFRLQHEALLAFRKPLLDTAFLVSSELGHPGPFKSVRQWQGGEDGNG